MPKFRVYGTFEVEKYAEFEAESLKQAEYRVLESDDPKLNWIEDDSECVSIGGIEEIE